MTLDNINHFAKVGSQSISGLCLLPSSYPEYTHDNSTSDAFLGLTPISGVLVNESGHDSSGSSPDQPPPPTNIAIWDSSIANIFGPQVPKESLHNPQNIENTVSSSKRSQNAPTGFMDASPLAPFTNGIATLASKLPEQVSSESSNTAQYPYRQTKSSNSEKLDGYVFPAELNSRPVPVSWINPPSFDDLVDSTQTEEAPRSTEEDVWEVESSTYYPRPPYRT